MLELIGDFVDGFTLSEIAGELDLPASSAHALAATLLDSGYLVRDQFSLRYRLGPRLGRLAAAFRSRTDLLTAASHAMDWLRRVTRETVSLTILEGVEIVFIDKRTADGQVQVVNPVGTRLGAHATGSGKAMLACLTDEGISDLYPSNVLETLTPFTISTLTGLLEALDSVRREGYALDEQESEMGVWATAAAIRGLSGNPEGAISIFAPFFRVKSEERRLWSEWVCKAAAEASVAMGYLPKRQ